MAQHQNVDLSEFGTHDMSSPTDTETETSESTISSPLTGDPDPCGDVILVIGSGEEVKRLKVATKVLTLASAMFAAMFSPPWAEGEGLSSTNPPNVCLKDDDPEAMHWMLSVLHYCKDVNRAELSLQTLQKVALLCDKYDCCTALAPWAQQHIKRLYDAEEYPLAPLWLSYIFGHSRSFWKITRNMMQSLIWVDDTKDGKTVEVIRGEGLLPDQLTDSLRMCRLHSVLELQRTIETEFKPLLEWAAAPCGFSTCQASARAIHYMSELHRLELYPLMEVQEHTSIKQILSRLEDYKIFVPPENCICLERSPDGGNLARAIRDFRVKGLCLDCVKAGRLGGLEDNCMSSGKCED